MNDLDKFKLSVGFARMVADENFRQAAVDRLDAMTGRDEGGILPPRDIQSIDRSKNPWWKNQYES